MGATTSDEELAERLEVSTHAPVMGATCCWFAATGSCRCFNPRARDGRDSADGLPPVGLICFNPRARDGRDFCLDVITSITLIVSTHAPVMGATFSFIIASLPMEFQPTRP